MPLVGWTNLNPILDGDIVYYLVDFFNIPSPRTYLRVQSLDGVATIFFLSPMFRTQLHQPGTFEGRSNNWATAPLHYLVDN